MGHPEPSPSCAHTRRSASPADRQRRGADHVGGLLTLELLTAADDAEIQPHRARPEHRHARLYVAHEDVLVDTGAVLERIAVKKHIAPHCPSLHADEAIDAEIAVEIVGVEVVGAGE